MNQTRRYLSLVCGIVFFLSFTRIPTPADLLKQAKRTATTGHHKYDIRNINISSPFQPPPPATCFHPGIPNPPDVPYSRHIVMAALRADDISWIHETHPKIPKSIYVVDSNSTAGPSGPKTPLNKGHEAMAYLTYIIDQYTNLSDTTLFLHSHRYSWHNNPLLNTDSVETIALLDDDHVVHEGYFNTRCAADPGCPDWIHLDRPTAELDPHTKPEEKYFTTKVWQELFPDMPLPGTIPGEGRGVGQACCAQFAVSRQRIRARPVEDYIRYRDWLIESKLTDDVLGRIFEYSWQVIFKGKAEDCPNLQVCYCSGYGICFQDGEKGVKGWLDVMKKREVLQGELEWVKEEGKKGNGKGGDSDEAAWLRMRIGRLNDELIERRKVAWERGKRLRESEKRAKAKNRFMKQGLRF
ncbi:MAG: hypothetical protein Q9227_004786 [Pyrenula ochraceoflavens]